MQRLPRKAQRCWPLPLHASPSDTRQQMWREGMAEMWREGMAAPPHPRLHAMHYPLPTPRVVLARMAVPAAKDIRQPRFPSGQLLQDCQAPALAYLAKFVELGEVGDRQQVDVDHAKELQVLKIGGKADDLPIVRTAVIQHQLLHLARGEGTRKPSSFKLPAVSSLESICTNPTGSPHSSEPND